MGLKKGRIVFIRGDCKKVRDKITELSAELPKTCKKILFIDTVNYINPHHPAYMLEDQETLFKRIYCARCPRPYDLLARIRTAGYFIRRNNIGAILINSLTLLFEDSDEDEVNPILKQILLELEELTRTLGLITVIGDSPKDSIPVRQAQATISAREAAA